MNVSEFRERAMSVLDYSRESGEFRWRVSKSRRVKPGTLAGAANNEKYVGIEIDGKSYKAHRLAWLFVYGDWPKSCIDHINGDRGDNRISNLREARKFENGQNRKLNKDNKSGHIGVHAYGSRWRAHISCRKRNHYLGTFDTLEDAAKAYTEAKMKLHTFNPVAREPTAGGAA